MIFWICGRLVVQWPSFVSYSRAGNGLRRDR
jgi:hypothetical protein